MSNSRGYIVVNIFMLTLGRICNCSEFSEFFSLINNSDSYNKFIIPRTNLSEPLKVFSSFYTKRIKFDDFEKMITLDLSLTMRWHDYRFTTPSVKNRDLRTIRVTSGISNIWVPDFFFRNSVETKAMASVRPEEFLEIQNSGNVLYSKRFLVKFQCNKIKNPNFSESQECLLYISSYGYNLKDLIFLLTEKTPVTTSSKDVQPSQKYSLKSSGTGYCERRTPTGHYSCLRLTFVIKRNFDLQSLELYISCISLVILAFLSDVLQGEHLSPRLILTIGPLITLKFLSIYYFEVIPDLHSVSPKYIFVCVSLGTIYTKVVYVLLSFFYSEKYVKEVIEEDERNPLKMFRRISRTGKRFRRILQFGAYVIFSVIYFVLNGFM